MIKHGVWADADSIRDIASLEENQIEDKRTNFDGGARDNFRAPARRLSPSHFY
jgi:hypothetical protein